jgi:hypothetical protein
MTMTAAMPPVQSLQRKCLQRMWCFRFGRDPTALGAIDGRIIAGRGAARQCPIGEAHIVGQVPWMPFEPCASRPKIAPI